tara:strand:- start:379 stop:531 length:153 start_codon:yes stop_codon:yes gene_type:complete
MDLGASPGSGGQTILVIMLRKKMFEFLVGFAALLYILHSLFPEGQGKEVD